MCSMAHMFEACVAGSCAISATGVLYGAEGPKACSWKSSLTYASLTCCPEDVEDQNQAFSNSTQFVMCVVVQPSGHCPRGDPASTTLPNDL